jgi:hypothetical protein
MRIKPLITILILLLINTVNSLKSTDICYKRYECKSGNDCIISNCTDLLSYDCNRIECTLDLASCLEYQLGVDEIAKRIHLKLDRASTVSLIQGISFNSRRLRNFSKMLKQITMCPV